MSKCDSMEKNVKLANIKKNDNNIATVKPTTKKLPTSTNKSPSTSSETSSGDDESSDSSYDDSGDEEIKQEDYSQVFESDDDSDADMGLLSEALEKTSMKRQNKTFSDHKIREIEHGNSVLMKKLVSNCNRRSQYTPTPPINTKLASSAINRKKKQTQIDRDNLVS